MNELIDVRALMRVSTYAKAINKTPTWIHKLADEGMIDKIIIDKVNFIVLNQKSRKLISK